MKTAAAVIMAAMSALIAGCEQPSNKMTNTPPAPVAEVNRVELWVTPPTVLKWTGREEPDGVMVIVYIYGPGRPLATPVTGRLEVLLFEAPGTASKPSEEGKPFFTWSFSRDQLRGLLVRTNVGWAYSMRLAWGDRVPKSEKITLQARYTPPGGEPVVSEGSTIPMSTK